MGARGLAAKIAFDPGNIIEKYKLKELMEAKDEGKEIDDFLPYITSGGEDQVILKGWMDWFKGRGVPFAVTRHERKMSDRKIIRFVLWKIRSWAFIRPDGFGPYVRNEGL